MKPGETVRFLCEECLLVFYLCLALSSEWPEIQQEEFRESILVTCCPFCGSTEVRATGGTGPGINCAPPRRS
jgi:hypothetical protein